MHSFLQILFMSLIALFPVINPIGTALMVSPYFDGLTKKDRQASARKIALYAFSLCIIFLILGHLILKLFGITIPVIQLAGGIMICKTGWESLTSDKQSAAQPVSENSNSADLGLTNVQNKLFYPLTFPLTVGGGTISVLFTLGAHAEDPHTTNYILNLSAVALAVVIMCIVIIFLYQNTKILLGFLSAQTENIVNRIMAFLIFCIGLQIAITGLKSIF